ncbi:zinc-ribbon domain containing protein [Thermodesulfobacteriota bacterium]
MEDQFLTCIQCGEEFVFSAAEQGKYNSRGFDPPRRCPECRRKKAKGTESSFERNERHRRQRPEREWW